MEVELSSMYNCGCMMPYMNYKPRTLTQILEANAEMVGITYTVMYIQHSSGI